MSAKRENGFYWVRRAEEEGQHPPEVMEWYDGDWFSCEWDVHDDHQIRVLSERLTPPEVKP
jgi:hypothetical protein